MIKARHLRGPNSHPDLMQNFSLVNASKHAFPMSVPYKSSLFSSARKRTSIMPRSEITPEQTLERGTLVRFQSSTNLAL